MSLIRTLVSKKKRRYVGHGFNLDLTYITSRIIAMGFPSANMEGVYRNPIEEVVKFFEQFHKDSYKIYNLCSEREYDPSPFQGRVEKFPFDDHNAPPFDMIEPFCKNVDEWLEKNPDNVVAIHCKAGKGRTGVLICIYLLHCGVCKTADEAMDFYGVARTKDNKGLTIPSQRRYVRYYEQFLKFGRPPKQKLRLTRIVLSPVPNFSLGGGSEPYFRIVYKDPATGEQKEFLSKASMPIKKFSKSAASVDLPVKGDLELVDDVKLEMFHEGMKKTKMFHFWFNVDFVSANRLTVTKPVLDGANKSKKFASNFQVDLYFDAIGDGLAPVFASASLPVAAPAPDATIVSNPLTATPPTPAPAVTVSV
eukprot:TRINITY_DN12711_c0_g1_i1.p1 TRINITY_DN12711_c0_g1~~TRINITY_DN12711_c0_g1_i1.p1  ORF type:complete len:364 (+),score=68.34 TRINITY_DN12711_c0_g1_i1:117-1208(+)